MQNIKNLIEAFLSKYEDLIFIEGMDLIASFLLCFFNQENAFEIFCEIVEKILPKLFYKNSNNNNKEIYGFIKEKEIILGASKELLLFKKKTDEELIANFLNTFCEKFFPSLLINSLNFQCVYYAWDLMLQRSSV